MFYKTGYKTQLNTKLFCKLIIAKNVVFCLFFFRKESDFLAYPWGAIKCPGVTNLVFENH